MDILKKKIDEILLNYDYKEEGLLQLLLEVQKLDSSKYISKEIGMYIADKVKMPYSQFHEVFTFFFAINQSEKGKYHIEMCDSTVCRVNRKGPIQEYLEKELNISIGETTDDNMFTLDHAPCFGACDTSPSVRINKKVYGKLTVEKMETILNNLRGV